MNAVSRAEMNLLLQQRADGKLPGLHLDDGRRRRITGRGGSESSRGEGCGSGVSQV